MDRRKSALNPPSGNVLSDSAWNAQAGFVPPAALGGVKGPKASAIPRPSLGGLGATMPSGRASMAAVPSRASAVHQAAQSRVPRRETMAAGVAANVGHLAADLAALSVNEAENAGVGVGPQRAMARPSVSGRASMDRQSLSR